MTWPTCHIHSRSRFRSICLASSALHAASGGAWHRPFLRSLCKRRCCVLFASACRPTAPWVLHVIVFLGEIHVSYVCVPLSPVGTATGPFVRSDFLFCVLLVDRLSLPVDPISPRAHLSVPFWLGKKVQWTTARVQSFINICLLLFCPRLAACSRSAFAFLELPSYTPPQPQPP
jgi:hypothetical protein